VTQRSAEGTLQAEEVLELADHPFDDLAFARGPAAIGLRPRPPARPSVMGMAEQLGVRLDGGYSVLGPGARAMSSRWFATPRTTRFGAKIGNVDIHKDKGISHEDGSCGLHLFWPWLR